MHDGVLLLISWENFYVIIGSAAAALTGLMFVVITLIVGAEMQRGGETLGAFGTPTVVHFGVALLIAMLISAPWPELWNVALLLGIIGLGGVIYVTIVIQRARHQMEYQPMLEDWLWHMILPLISYSGIFVAAFLLMSNPDPALFIVGAATVLFLFIGIHNSWDTVTYMLVVRSQADNKDQDNI
jgi:hypothetical protein